MWQHLNVFKEIIQIGTNSILRKKKKNVPKCIRAPGLEIPIEFHLKKKILASLGIGYALKLSLEKKKIRNGHESYVNRYFYHKILKLITKSTIFRRLIQCSTHHSLSFSCFIFLSAKKALLFFCESKIKSKPMFQMSFMLPERPNERNGWFLVRNVKLCTRITLSHLNLN